MTRVYRSDFVSVKWVISPSQFWLLTARSSTNFTATIDRSLWPTEDKLNCAHTLRHTLSTPHIPPSDQTWTRNGHIWRCEWNWINCCYAFLFTFVWTESSLRNMNRNELSLWHKQYIQIRSIRKIVGVHSKRVNCVYAFLEIRSKNSVRTFISICIMED